MMSLNERWDYLLRFEPKCGHWVAMPVRIVGEDQFVNDDDERELRIIPNADWGPPSEAAGS